MTTGVGLGDRWRQPALPLALLVAGAGLYYLGPDIVAPLGIALFIAAAWLRLDFALMSVVLVCPFYLPVAANPLPDRQFGSLRFSLAEAAILACAVAWALRIILPPRADDRPVMPSAASWAPMALFLLAAVISSLAAEFRQVAFRELRVVIVEPLLFGLMLVSTVDRRTAVRFGWAVAALGALVSLYSFYHYIVIRVVERTGGVRRVLAIYHSPNQLALLIDRLMPVALALALPLGGEPFRRWLRRFVPAGIVLVLLAGALLLTYSRGAWAAIGIAVLAVVAARGLKFLVPALIVAAAAAAVILSTISPSRLLSEQTSMQRPTIWSAALAMLHDHPVLGIGPDNFLYYYRDLGYMPPEAWAEPDISHPHNLGLDVWLRTGLLGLAAMILSQVVFWRAALRVLTSKRDTGWLVGVGFAGAMLAAIIHGAFDNGYFLPDLAILYWFGFAIMLVLARTSTERGTEWTS